MQKRPEIGDIKQTDAQDERSLEELFAEAEELIGHMEEPELSLEEAFAAYEQGMKIIRACNSRIDLVEQKMLVMNEEGDLVPFEDH
ncbi:MAG: exodeoxyribonuclease VII small subunit [Lachnospiraceae bacterium]|nr:exodeoxyribonuclease VII small subunit [Lachnospiraceae bacterium]MDD7177381.1 exodeoxyribonuclease VII small subunit [bacterium]MDY5518352.1 exodeoxyribonuclease VII small subunit [Lachnospiraceae bacterium]